MRKCELNISYFLKMLFFFVICATLSKEKGLFSMQFEVQSYWKCCFGINAQVLGSSVWKKLLILVEISGFKNMQISFLWRTFSHVSTDSSEHN